MANSKKRCAYCKEYFQQVNMIKSPSGMSFCSMDHQIKYAVEKSKKANERKIAKAKKMNDDFAKVVAMPKRKQQEYLRSRSDWYAILQTLLNQYIVHVRDKNKACCTCGTSDPALKYDAGHCFTRGARSELRFELTNIHKQCSNNCNLHNSGRQAEHKVFIAEKYGADHLEKMEDRTQWKILKEQFPHIDDIKEEISRYRKLLRDNGLKPNI